MITEEKIQEIKRWLRKGQPEGEIKGRLLKEGYTDKILIKHLSHTNIICVAGIYTLLFLLDYSEYLY